MDGWMRVRYNLFKGQREKAWVSDQPSELPAVVYASKTRRGYTRES